jgi:serine/threonine protein kinase
VRLVDQIGAALMAAHRQGVVHGQLKPENILFDDEGNAYLTHFGISSDVRRSRGSAALTTSTFLTYIAPEQLRGEPATPLSDQYSLALVVAEVLTGRSPLQKKALAAGQNQQLPDLRNGAWN